MSVTRGAIFIGAQHDDFIGETIRSTTHSIWSHCAIISDSTQFETYILGARDKGIDYTTLTDYDNNSKYYYEIYNIEIPDYLIRRALRKVTDEYFGKPYGYFELLGFWIQYKLRDWFNIKLKHNPITLWTVCSELDAIYLKELLSNIIPELNEWTPGDIVPEHIYQLMKKYPDIFKLTRIKTSTWKD